MPEVVISPCFLSNDIKNISKFKKINRVGPIVRLGIKKRQKKENKRGAIMLYVYLIEINLKDNEDNKWIS